MSTTTEPAVTHPAWCDGDPSRCDQDRTGGYLRDVSHGSEPQSWHASHGTEELDAVAYLVRNDNHDGTGASEPTHVYMTLNGYAPVTVDQLEEFGRWLIARAGEYRQAIATEGGAR